MDVNDYLNIVTAANASDLFISSGACPTIRVSGELKVIENIPLPSSKTKEIAYSLMNAEQTAAFEQNLEMNLAIVTPTSRFRVNIFKQRGDIGLVIRSIKLKIPSMESLGLPAETFKKIIMKKRGLILFVGATSSGKSTSLASLIDYRNTNHAGHIITIEDPMEFVHPHKKSIIEQREVGFDTKTYENALQNTLRQAPDVILIGEVRSSETMEYAVTFAETGHLCLSTLHANSANQAFARILSFFPEERHARVLLELSLNIRAIISQRLIPCVQGGLVPAIEILLDSPLVKELIKRGSIGELKEAMQKSELAGMQTFDSSLYKLYKAGKISYESALLNADSANDLRLKIALEEAAKISYENNMNNPEASANSNPEPKTSTAQNTASNNTESKSVLAEHLKKSIAGLTLEKKDGEDESGGGFFQR